MFTTEACRAIRYECLFVYFDHVLISSVAVAVKAALHADLSLVNVGSYVVQATVVENCRLW